LEEKEKTDKRMSEVRQTRTMTNDLELIMELFFFSLLFSRKFGSNGLVSSISLVGDSNMLLIESNSNQTWGDLIYLSIDN
jgi:hypothetical protein